MFSVREHGEWLADLMITVKMLEFYELGEQVETVTFEADFKYATEKLVDIFRTKEAKEYLNE